MGKTATFTEKDHELILKIQSFQKEKELTSFIEAVRQLCDAALQAQNLARKLN